MQVSKDERLVIYCTLIFIVLMAIILIVKDDDKNSFDLNKDDIYNINKISITAEKQVIIIQPEINAIGASWTVEPKFPDSLNIYSEEINFTGDIIDSFDDRTCTIIPDDVAICWEVSDDDIITERITKLSRRGIITDISVGGGHLCAINNDFVSEILCWGSNNDGQLGSNQKNTKQGEVFFLINEIDNLTWNMITTGASHSCGLSGLNNIFCWGSGNFGQIGNGKDNATNIPLKVNLSSLSKIEKIESGGHHTCALGDGEIYCWGWNGLGQLGDGSFENKNYPIRVKNLQNKVIEDISIGKSHSCALATTEEIFCWESNLESQINNNSNNWYENPIKLENDYEEIISVMAGTEHTCVVGIISYSCIGMDIINKNYDGIRGFSSGEKYNCFITMQDRISCDGDLEAIINDVDDLLSYKLPKGLISGSIFGTISEQNDSTYFISRIHNGEIKTDNISFIFEIGSDNDYDSWSNDSEIECNTDPNNESDYPSDLDMDGICDFIDVDNDGDGVEDIKDAFPNNPVEWKDDDRDGVGSNSEILDISPPTKGLILTLSLLLILLILESKEIFIRK